MKEVRESLSGYFFKKRTINDIKRARQTLLNSDFSDIDRPEYDRCLGILDKDEKNFKLLGSWYPNVISLLGIIGTASHLYRYISQGDEDISTLA
ncbi:hypothetical protein FJZ18_02485 [Candidatus Pacearchaeota archaeon]|nr:hypothetical protein [Candidatus Pacearchaeota archaeon]